MTEPYYAVIMAGGGGTRLWPLSRQHQPKQFLRLGADRSLFQQSVDRLEGVFSPDRIFVVTIADQAPELKLQAPQIPSQNFILEPMPRGTAAVVGLAAMLLNQMDAQASMAVVTADHLIGNVPHFHQLLRTAYQVSQQGYLMTLGIRPTYAATGYGYIQRGERLDFVDGQPVYRVQRFKEKPNEAAAAEFLAGGDHDWNSGMFIWRADTILAEFRRLMPELFGQLQIICPQWGSPRFDVVMSEIWPKIRPETIDYGIMEKANQVAVLPASDLAWNDVGSWDSLFEVLPADENGNIILSAHHVELDSTSSLIFAEDAERLITTIGVKNLIIVDTGSALLICQRNDSQQVREIVNILKKSGLTRYL